MLLSIERTGIGINTRFNVTIGVDVNGEPVEFYGDGWDDARFLGILRGKAGFDDVDVESFTPPVTPTKAECQCDIKDLMSTGHTVGCPEKK